MTPVRKQSYNEPPLLISLNDAAKLTTLSRTQLNILRGDGRFPQPVALGERRIAFVRAEVVAWIGDRVAARAAENAK